MSEQRWVRTPASWAVQVSGLTKRFGQTQAVAGLDLNIPVGGVHGLLGPNGSGKTTTLRLLLGLLRPDGGQMRIFDRPVPSQLPDVIDRVGAIIESPRLNPAMSVQRNLEIIALATGVSRSRITEVLLEVGMHGRARSTFASCSLGMKQRVAIAATLLKEPDLLIFDGPTNGLDPAGIQEIRMTMRALADAGRTVVISSHLLGEIEQIADSVSIIGRGQVIAEGNLEEFLRDGRRHVVAEVRDISLASEVLRQAGYASTLVAGRLHVTRDDDLDPSDVARVLGSVGLWPSHLSMQQASLEAVFLELTAGEHLTATQGRQAS